ncbi:lipoyl(octanoyl) transferase LipB [Alphaproteobacteria bacterium]|nr:lipoyl(octanoyl) transferase LipB [Alphaproteobacteria bacterium]
MKYLNNIYTNIEFLESKNPILYEQALTFMEERANSLKNNKKSEIIWFLEHPSIYTSGRGSFINENYINNIPVYNTGRGGKITWHGPGQRIIYFIINIKKRNIDIRSFVSNIEMFIINSLAQFNIKAYKKEKLVGIWTKNKDREDAKISSLGLRVTRGIIYHGVSININCDLSNFYNIEPCGISRPCVTSVEEINGSIDMNEVDCVLKKNIKYLFNS